MTSGEKGSYSTAAEPMRAARYYLARPAISSPRMGLRERTPPTAEEYAEYRTRFTNWGRWGTRRRVRHPELHHARGAARRRAARERGPCDLVQPSDQHAPGSCEPLSGAPPGGRPRLGRDGRLLLDVRPRFRARRISTRSAICRRPSPSSRGTARASTATTCRPTTPARSTSGATASSRAACSYDIPRLRGTRASKAAHPCTDGSWPTPPRRRAWSRVPATPCSSAAASGRTSTPTAAQQGFLSPAGVHASCIEYLAEHDASMLVWDMQDAPIADQGIPNPRPISRCRCTCTRS